MLAVFQSRGWSSTTRAYSAMAASSRPWRSSFSAFFSVSSRSKAKEGFSAGERGRAGLRLDSIKQRGRPERSAVDVGIAEPRHRIEVVAGGVALVAIEAVARIPPVQIEHHPIARDLGDDRGRRNRRAPAVAVDHAAL